MNLPKNIIQRCHQRHEKPLRQRKTVVTPAIYKGITFHFTVFCAHRHPVRLHDMELADISFMPIGGAPTFERMPQSFGGTRFRTRQGIESWKIRQWQTSWGIQIYTGISSEHGGARWHDLEFTYQAICATPEVVLDCIETLANAVANPLLTITKSGGLRFSCRIPNYLHPNTESDRFYVYKDILTSENQYQRNIYLEIRGDEGHSPWDARYEILCGNLLKPPIIAREVLFTVIDAFRSQLHDPTPSGSNFRIETSWESELHPNNITLTPPSLGSYKLDLAKETFLKHGFVYVRQENDLHHWTKHPIGNDNAIVYLWEHDNTIWIRATKPNVGLPTEDTPITSVWDNTGLLPSVPKPGLQVSEQMLAVREGKLSPLAIKRTDPVLEKSEEMKKEYKTLANNIDRLQNVFDSKSRITAPTFADIGVRSNYAIETHLLKTGAVSLSAHIPILDEASRHFEKQNLPSITRWWRHNYLWDSVKDIPVDVRMQNPFQNGNICEDADRCITLVSKGVDPSETICPQCPVYTACQQHGYLSQSTSLQTAKTQLIAHSKIFLDPSLSTFVENILKPVTHTDRLCIIDEVRADELFLDCYIDINTLETWNKEWAGHALGNFAQALLNALKIKSSPDDELVKRIRTVMQAFQQYEAHIVQQICQVKVRGRVVEDEIDEDTGAKLARYTVMFENGMSVYIPINNTAADRLTTKGLPVLQPDTVVSNEDTAIPIPIKQAIRLGILDVSSPEKIEKLAKTYPNPDWTLWHQLKRFFAHYTRDSDTPMIWYKKYLKFWVPPVLNPNVKRLLLMSPTICEQDLHRTFPNEEIEMVNIQPNLWMEGNRVFQIRTGVHALQTMLDYDNSWDVVGLSKTGIRIMQDICAEIQRDLSIKHAIITYRSIIMQLKHIEEKENVCLLTEFKYLSNLEAAFEAAQVVWIVGTPYWQPSVMWLRSQILYGGDEKPLCYEADNEFQHFKDPRIQRVYIQTITGLITDIIGRAGLNRLPDKKVVLINSLQLPNITDRPETFLFDWEDFEIAGGLDKLPEVIATRERFEADYANLTGDSSREEVERILGCSPRTANRVLQKLRGGNIQRISIRKQILFLLATGEKRTSLLVEVIDSSAQAIGNELKRLLNEGKIVRVRRGVYKLPDTGNNT